MRYLCVAILVASGVLCRTGFAQPAPPSETTELQKRRENLDRYKQALEYLSQPESASLQTAPPSLFRIGSRAVESESDAQVQRIAARFDTMLGDRVAQSGGFSGGPLRGVARHLPFAPGVTLVHLECGPYDAPDGSRKLVWGGALVRGDDIRPLAMGAFRNVPEAIDSLNGQFPGLKLTAATATDYTRLLSHVMFLNDGIVESVDDLRSRLKDPASLKEPLLEQVTAAIHPLSVDAVNQTPEGPTFRISGTMTFWGSLMSFKWTIREDGTEVPETDPAAISIVIEGLPASKSVPPRSLPQPKTPVATPPVAGRTNKPEGAKNAVAENTRFAEFLRTLEAARPTTAGEMLRDMRRFTLAIRASGFNTSSALERTFDDENVRRAVDKSLRDRGFELAEKPTADTTPLVITIGRVQSSTSRSTVGALGIDASIIAPTWHFAGDRFVLNLSAIGRSSASYGYDESFRQKDLAGLIDQIVGRALSGVAHDHPPTAAGWASLVADVRARAAESADASSRLGFFFSGGGDHVPCAVDRGRQVRGLASPRRPVVSYWDNYRVDLFDAEKQELDRLKKLWSQRSPFDVRGVKRPTEIRHDLYHFRMNLFQAEDDLYSWVSDLAVIDPYSIVLTKDGPRYFPAAVLGQLDVTSGDSHSLLFPSRARSEMLDTLMSDAFRPFEPVP